MKVGAIVRLNRKGLGYQTRAFADHYGADRILKLHLRDKRFPDDSWLYSDHPDAISIYADPDRGFGHSEELVRSWMDGLDVVFSAETLYDWRLADWARDEGVLTVVQGNPEFYIHDRQPIPHPDRWIWPTPWLLDRMPSRAIVPCPVPDDLEFVAGHPDDDEFRVLHVAGHKAAGDRNGTDDFMLAIAKIRTDVTVTVIGQDGWLPPISSVPRNVNLITNPVGVDEPIDLYRGQHLVVLPRRYGGNCLPANEACAAGCALSMPAVSPNERWPILELQPRPGRMHLTPYGPVKTCSIRPDVIAAVIDRTNRNRTKLAAAQSASRSWARANTWSALRGLYEEALTP